MTLQNRRFPPGPAEKYDTSRDLLTWLHDNFRKFGDIFKASIYGVDVYVLNSMPYIERVLLKEWENYPKGLAIKRVAMLVGNGLMVSTGDHWVRQRRMIQPAFNRDRLQRLLGIIMAVNVKLLEKWTCAAQTATAVNVTQDVSRVVLEILLVSIFGEDYREVAPYFQIISDGERNLEFAMRFKSVGKIIARVVERRQKTKIQSNDILGTIMQSRDRDTDQLMSIPHLTQEIMTLIVAGHETTAGTLSWIWYLLSRHPAAAMKLASELSEISRTAAPLHFALQKLMYAQHVIDEALRLYPPGWLMTRRAILDDEFGDYFVPAGTEIYISPFLLNRHPKYWDMPDTFNPSRFESQDPLFELPKPIPFSTGPRNCIGENFAMIEMQIHVMTIGGRLEMTTETDKPMGVVAGINLLSSGDIWLTPRFISSR